MTKNKRAKIEQRQFVLWPDQNGLLTLPPPSDARSSASRSLRLRPLPRVVKVRAWPLLSSRYSASSLSVKNLAGAFFGVVVESLFGVWLLNFVYVADYQAVSLAAVIEGARVELGLDPERTKRLLIKATAARGEFRSDGQLLTLR